VLIETFIRKQLRLKAHTVTKVEEADLRMRLPHKSPNVWNPTRLRYTGGAVLSARSAGRITAKSPHFDYVGTGCYLMAEAGEP
jgi:hypothetical protein